MPMTLQIPANTPINHTVPKTRLSGLHFYPESMTLASVSLILLALNAAELCKIKNNKDYGLFKSLILALKESLYTTSYQ